MNLHILFLKILNSQPYFHLNNGASVGVIERGSTFSFSQDILTLASLFRRNLLNIIYQFPILYTNVNHILFVRKLLDFFVLENCKVHLCLMAQVIWKDGKIYMPMIKLHLYLISWPREDDTFWCSTEGSDACNFDF